MKALTLWTAFRRGASLLDHVKPNAAKPVRVSPRFYRSVLIAAPIALALWVLLIVGAVHAIALITQ
jgi:hypothetical protein